MLSQTFSMLWHKSITATLNNVNRTQKEINLKVNPLIKKNFQIYTTILMFDTVYYSYHE